MSAFLEDITPFYGTGQKNEINQDLEKFLDVYDPKQYENPSVTVDVLVIQPPKEIKTVEKGLKILMIKRRNHPCIGYWALPGGFVEIDEDLETAAKRELEEETNLTGVSLEQLHAWGDYQRDPRARIITISYLAFVEGSRSIKAGDDASDALWMDLVMTKGKTERVEEDDNKIKTYYNLEMVNKEIHLSAELFEIKKEHGLLSERSYQVVRSETIACDHAKIILQALLYIEELIH